MAQFLTGFKDLDWIKFMVLLTLWVFDANFRIGSNCVYPRHYFMGIFFGLVLGVLWYYLVKDLNSNMLLKGTSDKKKCDIINSNMTCKIVKVDGDGNQISEMQFAELLQNHEDLKKIHGDNNTDTDGLQVNSHT